MAHMLFDPETALDDAWVYVVSHGGKNFALFPYISALTPVPTLASIYHQIDGMEITKEERRELAALVKRHGTGGRWLFDGVFAWLVTPVEWSNVMRREIERQNDQLHAASRTAAPRRKGPLVRHPGRMAGERQPLTATAKPKTKSSRG
jgi:hypothetical protein